jgi:arylsulfatase A-like enzyme
VRTNVSRSLAGLLLLALTGPSASAADRPNVIFILADDLGWRDLGCTGSKFYETPNLARLAARGMRFTEAYAACPVCSPTRASILTGKYPVRFPITDYIPGNRRERPERPLFWHYPHYGNQGGAPCGAMRLGDLKLFKWFEDDRVELYNLRDDPGETRDLAADRPEVATALRQRLRDWRASVNVRMPTPNPDFQAGAAGPRGSRIRRGE